MALDQRAAYLVIHEQCSIILQQMQASQI